MSEDVKLCPICGLKLSPNLSNYNPAENFCPRHSDTRWREYYDALIAERDALRAKLEIAVEALETVHTAISSLPIDSLGTGEIDWNGEPYQYPIRDEVIDNINKALQKIKEEK